MSLLIKVCGITSPEALDAAINAGAHAVGFVFADSPRKVSTTIAAKLAKKVPGSVLKFGVFRHPSPELVARVAASVPLDFAQSDASDEEMFKGFAPQKFQFLPVLRDGPNLTKDLEVELARGRGRPIMIEAPVSGAGVKPDWRRIAALRERPRTYLAGGLTPENVAEAIRVVKPYAVDVSSGVESAPGIKDPDKIKAFIAAVRAANAAAKPGTPTALR